MAEFLIGGSRRPFRRLLNASLLYLFFERVRGNLRGVLQAETGIFIELNRLLDRRLLERSKRTDAYNVVEILFVEFSF